MKEFWSMVQMFFTGIGGWLQGDLPKGVNLYAYRNRKYFRCTGYWNRVSA